MIRKMIHESFFVKNNKKGVVVFQMVKFIWIFNYISIVIVSAIINSNYLPFVYLFV